MKKLRKKIILGTVIISLGVISPMIIQLNTHKTINTKTLLKNVTNNIKGFGHNPVDIPINTTTSGKITGENNYATYTPAPLTGTSIFPTYTTESGDSTSNGDLSNGDKIKLEYSLKSGYVWSDHTTYIYVSVYDVANLPSSDSDHYKYTVHGDPSKQHNTDYEYNLSIGTSDINYLYGADYFVTDNGTKQFWEHKAHTPPGDPEDTYNGKNYKIKQLEYYFNSSGAHQWGYAGDVLFPSKFDKDMNGKESRMFSQDNVMLTICLSGLWKKAYTYNENIVIHYETWYSDYLHIGMHDSMYMYTN